MNSKIEQFRTNIAGGEFMKILDNAKYVPNRDYEANMQISQIFRT